MKIVQVFCLSLFFSLCGATEYYVRPTGPTDTSCPAQPCLTLSHYISNSDLYFKSNTVFKFLPGLHHANQTLDMQSVENVSLEGEHNSDLPIVMMDINCSSHGCDGFQFHNISNLTIHSLNIFIYIDGVYMHDQECPVGGFMFFEVSHLLMYNANVEFTSSGSLYSSGLRVFESRQIFLHSLTAICGNYCRVIDIEDSDNILILNVSVAFGEDGIVIESSQYTRISNTIVMNSQWTGIQLKKSSNADIMNTSVLSSENTAIFLSHVHYVVVANTSITESSTDGIRVLYSTNITFSEISVMYIGMKSYTGETEIGKNVFCNFFDCNGLKLMQTNSVFLYGVRVMHSTTGIVISSCVNITTKNTTVTHVKKGITSHDSSKTHISCTMLNISKYAIRIVENNDSVITNVILMFIQCQETIISLHECRNVEMKNIFIADNRFPRWMIRPQPAISINDCNGVAVSKSVFANLSYPCELPGWLAIVALSGSSNIDFSDCSFKNNTPTALRVTCSQFTVSGILQFTGNRAIIGGAIVFDFGSTMKLSHNSSILFIDNHASFHGGAIYLQARGDFSSCDNISYPKCFLQLEQHDSDKALIFVNNSAEKGGDVMYGRKNTPCFLLFNNISHISPDSLSKVASDPCHVCFCKNNTPECSGGVLVDPIFPGQSFSVSVVIVGDDTGGTVAGSVFATFIAIHSIRPQLAAGEDTQKVTQLHCNELKYTIFSRNSLEKLGLTTVSTVGEYSDAVLLTEWPTFINIPLLPCPPGFALMEASARCDCSQFVLQLPGVSCNIKDQTIHRSGLVWVGSVRDENQAVENVVITKHCPLNYCKHEGISVDLNQTDTQCEFNHSGILCGGCQPGLSLMLGGVQCGVCSNRNLALILPFLLAGVVLVFFLKISNLTTSEGFINSLVFYASIVKANEHIFLPQTNTNPLTLFISWLNLDLGIQTCFFNGLNAYTKTWLQFVFPFYIWSITGVIIISARYSTRIARISGNNSVPVLATLFLLSYAKLLVIIITSLSYTVLEYPGGQKVVWSADGNIDYLGAKHAPLFVAAVATLLFLWLPYTVLLFTGQWLYKCKLSLTNHMLIKLKPFLDAHYGPLKDSHRYWFGALLLVRAVILLISALMIKDNFSVFIFSISVATIVLIIMLTTFSHISIDLRAYHSKAVSSFEYSIFFNLVLLCLAKYHTSASGGSDIAASYSLIGIVFLQFVGVLIFRVYSSVKNKVFHYFPMNESKEEEGVWRYENSIEMQTTQYRNANNIL